MSYLYDSLKEALGGKGFKSGVVINDWTPNEVRSVFIMRDFILISDYLKSPKVYPLDVNRVISELENNQSRGSLNKLLENRQLSCMEEIYVDDIFTPYKNLIDLDGYVANNFGQVSRLRYYGYVHGLSASVLVNLYTSALINGDMDFVVANRVGNYNDTGNSEWYKKYNLRPQYYALDRERGKLCTYFSKCEKVVGSAIEERLNASVRSSLEDWMVSMFLADVGIASNILDIHHYIRHCKECDTFANNVGNCLEKHLFSGTKIKGLSKDMLLQTLNNRGVKISDAEKFILKLYENCSLYDEDGRDISYSNSDAVGGFYNLEGRLDSALGEIVSISNVGGDVLIMALVSKRNTKGLPKGRLSEALMKKNILLCKETGSSNLGGLFQFTFGLCGYKYSEFKAYISSRC